MKNQIVLILLLLMTVANHAVNVTVFPGGKIQKRLAAPSSSEYVVTLSCVLTWPNIETLLVQLPLKLRECRLVRVGQGSDVALLNVECQNGRDARFTTTMIMTMRVLLGTACCQAPLFAISVDETFHKTGATPWHLDFIDQRNWPMDNAPYSPLHNGSGVLVYHIDTGVRASHSEFGGRAQVIADYVDPAIFSDCNGHGTHTAALVVGKTYGTAPGAHLLAIRALDCNGAGTLSNILLALIEIRDRQLCANCRHAAVLSMSVSGGLNLQINAFLNSLVIDYNVGVVVAAGNNGGMDSCSYSPGAAAEVLTVAATTDTGALADFSNRGATCTDIAGPGEYVRSAFYYDDASERVLSGTSMTTPLVAGALAQRMQTEWATVSASEIQRRLVASATRALISPLPLLYVTSRPTPPSPPSPRFLPPPPPPTPSVVAKPTTAVPAPPWWKSNANRILIEDYHIFGLSCAVIHLFMI